MGLTDFPSAASTDAVTFAYQTLTQDGDMAAWLWDDGVPWPEALSGGPYAPTYMAEIQRRVENTPPGHLVYAAVTPISSTHAGLALYKGESGNQPLPPPWNARTFDDPSVIQAFANHCERIIAATQPQYFSYATEANMLFEFAPADWPAFVRLATAVYPILKASHPDLTIFVTVQADTFHRSEAAQRTIVQQILPYTDAMVISTYPYIADSDPSRLPGDYLSSLRDLAPDKPFAIAETCWPGENVQAPYPVFIPSSDQTQQAYIEWLLGQANGLQARFVTWSFSRDYDALWESSLMRFPSLGLVLFKNCGLFTDAGQARPGLAVWQQWLGRQRVG
jgi:hypothetical protein